MKKLEGMEWVLGVVGLLRTEVRAPSRSSLGLRLEDAGGYGAGEKVPGKKALSKAVARWRSRCFFDDAGNP